MGTFNRQVGGRAAWITVLIAGNAWANSTVISTVTPSPATATQPVSVYITGGTEDQYHTYFSIYANGKALCTTAPSNGTPIWNCSGSIASAGTYSLTAVCSNSNSFSPPTPRALTVNALPAVTGYIRPKYQVVGVYYAPPGAKSTVTYSNGFLSGTKAMVTNSFGTSIAVSVTAQAGLNLFGIFEAGESNTTSYGWDQQENSSSTISIVENQATGSVWPGPTSSALGVDHIYDTIAILLNPEISVSVIGGTSLTINGYFFDPRDPADGPDIAYLTVGQLNGTQTIDTATRAALNRTWDSSLGALHVADFAAIVTADPFATNPGFDPQTDTTNRYVFPNGVDQIFSYQPEPQGAGSAAQTYTSSYNATKDLVHGGPNKYSVGFSIDATLSASFFATALGNLKASTTFTYTNTWSNTVTSGTSQSANFTIFRPLYTDGYTGPINMQVWKDNVYGTFMFYPVP